MDFMDYSKTSTVINLTAHSVRFCIVEGKGKRIIEIPPSGKIARLRISSTPLGEVPHEGSNMPVVLSGNNGVINVPEPKEGTIYIVSSVVAKALLREDVLSPDTTDDGVLRDGQGNVYAVKRLQCFQ